MNAKNLGGVALDVGHMTGSVPACAKSPVVAIATTGGCARRQRAGCCFHAPPT